MGRPKGSKNVKSEGISSDASHVTGIESTHITHEKDEEIKPIVVLPKEPANIEIKEKTEITVKKELPPPSEGMKYFEAPDGTIYEGPKDKNFIIKHGMTINPKR